MNWIGLDLGHKAKPRAMYSYGRKASRQEGNKSLEKKMEVYWVSGMKKLATRQIPCKKASKVPFSTKKKESMEIWHSIHDKGYIKD